MSPFRPLVHSGGRALVAQGIERLPPEQKVVGSNPIEGTFLSPESPFVSGHDCLVNQYQAGPRCM